MCMSVVAVKKNSTPVLWLDTSIIVNMTQYANGHKLQPGHMKRIRSLYRKVLRATREGLLVCPLANQDDEIWVERELWLETIQTLSLGISTRSVLGLERVLFSKFVRGFMAQESIEIQGSILFHQDPTQQLRQAIDRGFFVAINPPMIGGRAAHDNLLEAVNEARLRNLTEGVTRAQQRDREFMVQFEIIDAVVRGEILPIPENADVVENSLYYWRKWCQLKEQTGFEGEFRDFFESAYYREMPLKRLAVEFYSKLMTDSQPVRSGDMKDVEHISTVFPFVDIFITDKQRRTELKKMKYDKLYDTKVCYIGDDEMIDEFFKSLSNN